MEKFTFKKYIPTGRYRSFEKDYTEIKLNEKVCGAISQIGVHEYIVRLEVMKNEKDLSDPKNNQNCEYKWIAFKTKFKTEKEAREFVNSDQVHNYIEKNIHYI